MAPMSIAAFRDRVQQSRKTALALAITLVVVTAPYWEVLTGRRTAMYGDVNDFYVPGYVAVWRTIRAGRLPWWTQNVFGGHSMVGSGQYGVFYPLNAAFGWLDPVTAYRLWMLAHLWIAAAGAFAWSWHRWRSRPGAIVSGFAYALSGFMVLHLLHPAFYAAAAWLPLLFLGIDLVIERWTRPRAALAAIPLALVGLVGQPQMVWIALAGAGVYIGARVLVRDCGWAGAGRAVGAIACGLAIAAIQLVPLLDFGRTSVRPVLAMTGAFENSVLPHHLLLLAFPYLYGGSSHGSLAAPWADVGLQQEVGNYLGITILAIAIAAIAFVPRHRAVRALAISTLAIVLVGMGGSTPVGHFVYLAVLGAREFRNWGRVLVIANLAVAMLAGVGVRELLRAPTRVLVWIGGSVVSLGWLVLLLPHLGAVQKILATGSPGTVARWFPIALLVSLAAAFALVAWHRRLGMSALIVVCAFDMVSFAYVAPWHSLSARPADAHAMYAETVPAFEAPHEVTGGIARWASDSYAFRSVSLAKDLLGVNGYDPLMQKDWAETAGNWLSDGYPTHPDLWQSGWTADVLRVSTLVLSNRIVPDHAWKREQAVPGIDFTRWIRTPRLADAYLVGAVDLAPLAVIQAELIDPHADLTAAAYVERRTPAMAGLTRPGPAGTVVSADLLDSGKVVVDAQRDALLVLSQGWEAGWRATVDGKGVPVVRTNGLVIGVTVPRGHHVVRVAFEPPGLRLGALLGLLGVLALLFAAPLIAFARTFRRTATPSTATHEPA